MRYSFDDCRLDTETHSFVRAGETIDIEPQVFALLALFVKSEGRLVSRDDMIEAVWNGRIVSDAAISSRINAVRRALGDDGTIQKYVQTVPRLGFRFLAEVSRAGAAPNHPKAVAAELQRVRYAKSADGTHIAYATTGTGPPLLRPGHYLTHLEYDWESPVWRPSLDRLGSRFSLTRYDQRGTGLSDQNITEYGLDTMVDDIIAVADAAGLERFPVLAMSQGVPVSLRLAHRYPDRVTRMVLYGGFAKGRALRSPEDEAAAQALLTLIQQGWGVSGGAFAQAFMTTFMPDATAEQILSLTKMQIASATPENAVKLRREIDRFDVTDILEEITVPALIMHCRDDAVHPESQSRLIASRLQNAELRMMEGRNHIYLPGTNAWETLMSSTEQFLGEAEE